VRRWIGGLSLREIVDQIPDAISPHRPPDDQGPRLEDAARGAYEGLGHVCVHVGQLPRLDGPTDGFYSQALFAFERGYVKAALEAPNGNTVHDLFSHYTPFFLASWEATLRGLVTAARWNLVREVLGILSASRGKMDSSLRAEAASWALRSGAADDDPAWLDPVRVTGYGLAESRGFSRDVHEELAPYLAIAYARGWTEVGMYSRDIATAVYEAFDPDGRRSDAEAPTLAVLRASALLGRADAA
jgi:hypothetical protein